MNIIIVGCGRVGRTLTRQLSDEGNNVTVIDMNADRVQSVAADNDVMGIVGNGASHSVLMDAGIESADLFIAVTSADELNLLCCLLAKKVGNCSTIARVRSPLYSQEATFIRKSLGLSMIINPELAAATEMARVLRFPQAIEINTFFKGRVELLKFRVSVGSVLDGLELMNLHSRLHCDVLVCAIERENDVIIPDGHTVIQAKDKVSFIASPQNAAAFFHAIGLDTLRVKDTMIIGGGRIAYYLAKQLIESGIKVKIIEMNRERCEELSVLLPKAMILFGDGSDKATLLEEGLENAQSFVALTGIDEENVMLSLYAKSKAKTRIKVVTKMKHTNFNEIIDTLDMDTVIYPQDITAEYILQYVRARQNTRGNNIETLYQLLEGRAEALEFKVSEEGPMTGIPFEKLNLKPNILICCISRNGKIIIPNGQEYIMPGDSVVVVTTKNRLKNITDILQD